MHTQKNFSVRPCLSPDVDGVVAFFERMHREKIFPYSFTKEDFTRKYSQARDSDPFKFFVLTDTCGSLIGVSGYVPFCGMLMGRPLPGFAASDTVIDPAYRERFPSLFAMLVRSYEKLVKRDKLLPLVMPLNTFIRTTYERLGWVEFVSVDTYSHPFFRQLKPHVPSAFDFCRIQRFDDEWAEFFCRISSQHHFLLHADARFLSARYAHVPCIVAARHKPSGRLAGYVVAAEKENNVHILELTVDLANPQLIVYLLMQAAGAVGDKKQGKVICCFSHRRYAEIAQRAGFCLQKTNVFLIFQWAGRLFGLLDEGLLQRSDRGLYHCNGFAPGSH